MATFIDGEPPRLATGTPSKEILEFAEELRHNPGKWAVHPSFLTEYNEGDTSRANSASTMVANINNGRTAALRDGFEARSAAGVVYVRFVEEA